MATDISKEELNHLQSLLGKIIDLPIEDFKEEIVKQRVNTGVINNLIILLSSTYHNLVDRKEGVLNLVFKGEKTKEEMQPVLEGIYAELTKLEQKIVYLTERHKELLDLRNTTS